MPSFIIRLLYLSLFIFTPLIFSSVNSELFEIPKMYFIYFLALSILILHLLNYLKGRVPLIRPTFFDIPLLLFLTAQTISTFFSIDRLTSFYGYYSRLNGGLLSLLVFALLYWILAVYLTPRHFDQLISVSLISGAVVSVYGILQHFGIDRHLWAQDVVSRVFSTFGQPNWLAAYLCILLPLSLGQIQKIKSSFFRFTFYVLPITFFICLLFTKSKSGLIAAAISLTPYFLLHLKTNFLRITYYLLPITFLILSLTINNPIKNIIFPSPTKIDNSKIENLNITPSADIRKIVWIGAIDLWKQFPLFGTGPETFAYSYYWTRPASHNLTSEWEFLYNKAHNEYLNFLATTGSFGLATYLLLIIVTLYQLCRHQQFALLAAYLSLLITNLSGFSISATSLFFFLIPAFTVLPIPTTKTKPKPLIFSLIFISLFLFLFSKILFFFLADVVYADALKSDDAADLTRSYSQLQLSLGYRSNFPLYLTHLSLVSAKLAVSSKSDTYLNKTISSSDLVQRLSPFDLNYWKQRAQIYYYLSSLNTDYYQEVLRSLTIASKLAPTDAKTFYLLGKFYENISDTDNALKYYQQAISLKSNYDLAYYELALIYFQQKKYSPAKTNFESALQIAPANADARNYLDKIAKLLE